MRSDERVMALCDTEDEYAQLMTDFLKRHKELPWKIHTYTSVQDLMKEEREELELLVISESAYCETLQGIRALKVVILSESGVMRWEDVRYVDKYQQAEEVLKELLQVYMEIADTHLPKMQRNCKTVFIGNYSPVKRALQTSFALTMSQLLARDHSTLYLNFEHYVGIAELYPDTQTLDMADLLYFLNSDREKFMLRLKSICKRLGSLDYVPPMKSGQNLLTITAEEWLGFLQKIEETGEYEYVILDLSESMQGLFDILRMCKVIFTLTKEDRVARSKLLQYEHLLTLYEYEDVLEKTRRLNLPHIQRLPEELEQLTRGDLAALVRDLLKGV